MKKISALQQHDAMDCGPTCLAMICKYYGNHYDITHIRNLCTTSHEGVSLYAISRAAENVGFRTIGIQLTISELGQESFLPCIIYWNQNHFVVLYKIKKTSRGLVFYVANPATGMIAKFNELEFGNCFLNSINAQGSGVGIALYLSPTNKFYEKKGDDNKKKIQALEFLYSYLKPYKKQFLLLIMVLIFGTTIQLTLPFLTQAIVDKGIKSQNINIIILILLGQMVLEMGNTFMGFLRNWLLLKTGTKINISLISDYLTKLIHLPISFFDTKQTGDILQRINDHSRIQGFLTDSSINAAFSIINIIIFGSIICIYNRIVSLIFFLGSILYIFWVWAFMKQRAILDNKIFTQNSANQSSIIQLVTGMQEIKLNVCGQRKRWEWEHIQHNIYRLSMKSLKLSQFQQSGGLFLNQAKNLIITAFVATLVIKGKITLGMMISTQYIVGTLNSPVDQLINFIRQFQDAQLSLDRLQDVYEKPDEDNEIKKNISDQDCGDIVLNAISFKYDKIDSRPNIDNVSLRIPQGKTTAIVGLSGSGKTTLLKLILGFYHPDKGTIYIGGERLDNINMQDWRKKCGTVMQEGFIFTDTIAHNIAPNATKIDISRIKKAARIANIDEFIEKLPLKYNTIIGYDGHNLSIGQKQRLLIARAVYKNPKYIFLDEATNSLDANNELEIMEHLNKFIKGKTAIVIAHRLSTVKNADNIIVLKDGKIVECGRHVDLITHRGLYYNLVKNQLGF
ncbi:peptidase domain-containing ABC transporter [Prevotella histicola]